MIKTIRIICIVLLLCTGTSAAQDKTITIANLKWLPYSGQFQPNYGIAPEIITAAFKRAGYRVQYNFMAWSLALEEVKKGTYDAVGTAYKTDERAKTYQFSDPYMDSPIVFFKRKDSDISWNTLEDLRPYKIGIIKGYANSVEFDKAEFIRKVRSRSEVLLLKKIILKQADLIVMDQFVGLYNIHEKLIGHEKMLLEPIKPPLTVHKLYVIFSKKVPGYLAKTEAFNRGLRSIKQDGTLREILVKHGVR